MEISFQAPGVSPMEEDGQQEWYSTSHSSSDFRPVMIVIALPRDSRDASGQNSDGFTGCVVRAKAR